MKDNNRIRVYLPRIEADLKLRFPMMGSFLALSILLRLFLKPNFPIIIILSVFVILLYTSLMAFIFNKFKEKLPELIIDLYFFSLCLDIILLAVIIHFLGGVTWIAPFFYSLIIVNVFWLLPEDKSIFLIVLSFLALFSVISLQYFEILPDIYIFSLGEIDIRNFNYALITALGSLAIIFFLSYASDLYHQVLNSQIADLKIAEKKLNKIKGSLEAEIQRRTENLKGEKKRLEEEVKNRTKELEEKKRVVQARVKELEKFHNVAIERELEMVSLKEEIESLRNKIRQ